MTQMTAAGECRTCRCVRDTRTQAAQEANTLVLHLQCWKRVR
jgi:hypothetical protein